MIKRRKRFSIELRERLRWNNKTKESKEFFYRYRSTRFRMKKSIDLFKSAGFGENKSLFHGSAQRTMKIHLRWKMAFIFRFNEAQEVKFSFMFTTQQSSLNANQLWRHKVQARKRFPMSIEQPCSSLSFCLNEKFIPQIDKRLALPQNKFAYNRPWPTEVACNRRRGGERDFKKLIARTSPRLCFASLLIVVVLLTKTNSFPATVHLHQIISFACALSASQWDVKESEGTQFLIISTSSFDWIHCFFRETRRKKFF